MSGRDAARDSARRPRRLALLCPGLYQVLDGARLEGLVFFLLAVAAVTVIVFCGLAPSDPYGRNAVRMALGAIALFWVALFSVLDSFQERGRTTLYLILLPAVLLFSTFTYYPLLWSMKLSFYRHDLGTLVRGDAPFVLLDNFAKIPRDAQFWLGLSNTLKFFFIGFLLGQLPAPTLAYLLNEVKSRRLQTAYKAVCFVPSLFSWPVIGAIWLWILKPDGQLDVLVSPILSMAGKGAVSWLGDPFVARFVFVCVGLWMGSGSSALIWLASLTGIDPTLYEAAEIDGAGNWGKFRHVTFPLLIPTWIVITVLSFIGMFGIFDQVIVMGNPKIREGVYVVMLHIFEQGFRYGHIGYASAMSLA
ncbi:MAG: sugar ABC transporter permease, partial [Planctomycetota bacterium]